jgi:flagellar FliJ protein
MNRSKRMQPVQDLMEDAERRLFRSLAGFEKRVLEAESKLLELERYLGEYQKQLAQRAGQGIGVLELRDYQAFLARLNDAIRQQRGVVQRACAERDAERSRWQEAARRAKAIDHVVEQWQVQERKAGDRLEQIEIDERAQRVKSER